MRILIVDDDKPFAHMLASQINLIEPKYFAIGQATASGARKAVKEADKRFDVFLLDQRLDGSDVDGVTLMEELQTASPKSDSIILTGYDDPESGYRAFEAGAHRYLTKPFDTHELINILKVLEKHVVFGLSAIG